MEMDIRNCLVEATSILYCAGITEDGSVYTAERIIVLVVRPDGMRLKHYKFYDGCEVSYDESGMTFFEDIRKEAYKQADHLIQRISTQGHINTDHWEKFQPVYGSEYYQSISHA